MIDFRCCRHKKASLYNGREKMPTKPPVTRYITDYLRISSILESAIGICMVLSALPPMARCV